MKKLKTSSAEMVAAARVRIEELESAELIGMLADPNVVIVDIRDVRERQRSGYIPGSMHAPRGCLLYTSPSPRDKRQSRMPSSA